MKYSPLIVTGLALWLAACKEKPAPESKAVPPAPAPVDAAAAATAAPAPTFAAPDTFKAALGKVFEGYSQIQGALAADDLAKAKEAFNTMHAVLHMMPKDGLDAAAKAYWESADARIMEALHPMAAADSLGPVRAHFMEFSGIMVEVIEKFGIEGSGPIYQFHCPMANGNKGADWLQKSKVLENPYFGQSMQKCGNLVRTLKG